MSKDGIAKASKNCSSILETKIKMLVAQGGDRNTIFSESYFCRRNNTINKLRIGEVIMDDKVVIREEILSFYQQQYTENEPWRPPLLASDVASIFWMKGNGLERNFEEGKIHATIKACAPDKPCEFTMAFSLHM